MRILVDCRYVRPEHHDGISRYTVGIVHALAARHPVEMLVSDRRQLAHLPEGRWHLISGPTSLREPFVAYQVRRLAPDVVFSPMQTMGSWGRRYRLVLTLHDLIYYRHRTPPPELPLALRALWRAYHLAWWPQRLLLDRADAVVTVSATTAGLIVRHRLTRRPVTVVANAADPPAVPPAASEPDTASGTRPPSAVLVYMGSFMPYKNVAILAAAMAALPDHELHLMSRVGPADRARLTALAGDGRLVFHDGASDATYRELLARATALLSASRDEGFGLPLVEAMSAGTPVVVSDIPIFREVGGDAATYVDPDDVDGFTRAVRELGTPETWERLSRAARRRAADYTWDDSAQRLLDLLEGTVRSGRHQ